LVEFRLALPLPATVTGNEGAPDHVALLLEGALKPLALPDVRAKPAMAAFETAANPVTVAEPVLLNPIVPCTLIPDAVSVRVRV
jgi:hypothetical protein